MKRTFIIFARLFVARIVRTAHVANSMGLDFPGRVVACDSMSPFVYFTVILPQKRI